MRNISFILSIVLCVLFSQAQNNPYQPGQIKRRLEKLNVLGSVLYIAAHPDDENTRLISYMANGELLRTAYLSATRGDGGQNLVGPEIREGLGVIRTQELLAARRTDGGSQFFTRANDFGYSKEPNETFTIWDKEKVLADMVWTIRKFRPDIMITRFSTIPGITHGHHTASAILAEEAFDLAGDSTAFPEQLSYVQPWQPIKLYWNTSWWFYRNSGQKMDTSKLETIDVGGYDPLLGKSYTEIAALSRSQHKSQSFGSAGSRGEQVEYLQFLKGEEGNSLFDRITTSWERIDGSEEMEFYINKAITEFDLAMPSRIIPSLLAARIAAGKLEDEHWSQIKVKELNELIKACSGLYIAMSTDQNSFVPGQELSVSLEVVNRSETKMKLKEVDLNLSYDILEYNTSLLPNQPFSADFKFSIPKGASYSHPYWLNEDASLGMYSVPDQTLIGKPENDFAISAEVTIQFGEESIQYMVPVEYAYTDPVDGEVREPVAIAPPVSMTVGDGVMVFGENEPKELSVVVSAGTENVNGVLKLELPKGWKSNPKQITVSLERKREEKVFNFQITPAKKASKGQISASFELGNQTYTRSEQLISYDHIPKQTLFDPAEINVVRLDLEKRGQLIGYIEGAGDAIPSNLEEIGYQVDLLEKEDVEATNLAKYDAVILGIRAFNTVDWLAFKNEELFTYAENGGNVIVQYNTNWRMVTEEVAPYPLQLSRDRVAVEEAAVKILAPDHPVMNTPNTITQDDFKDWVQERGLYFPNEWSEEFVPILESNDPGESPKQGGLLIAKHGKGHYIYSGYSWFRELPAGVSGAYRIFVNMISLGK